MNRGDSMKYDSIKAGGILKVLREQQGMSQRVLAVKLAEIIPDRVLDGDNGKNTVSQLENGKRGITIDYAFAYADIFDVTLDYIYGRDPDPQPKNKEIRETTELSDGAIKGISEINSEVLNFLLESQDFKEFAKVLYENLRIQLSLQKCDTKTIIDRDILVAVNIKPDDIKRGYEAKLKEVAGKMLEAYLTQENPVALKAFEEQSKFINWANKHNKKFREGRENNE